MEVLQTDNLSGIEGEYEPFDIDDANRSVDELNELVMEIDAKRPYWYRRGKETHNIIGDILRLAELPPTECFDAGNLIKYIRRAGYKGDDMDYKKDVYKAANYLHRLVFGEWLR